MLVQGDTTTTMAGALGAFQQGWKVGHVEAGLRTFDKHDPWPEEMNRRVAGVVADVHFAPTPSSAQNLYREGVSKDRVYVTGNTVIDALHAVAEMPFDADKTPLAELGSNGKRVIVATMHRREMTPEALEDVCLGLRAVAEGHPEVQIVIPVHRNPKVRGPVHSALGDVPNISLLDPLDYQPMVWLLRRSHFVITDSGGLQEEVTALGKPVIVIRGTTERPESVEAGNAVLVGTDGQALESWATSLLADEQTYEAMARSTNPYGSGDAAGKIVDILAARSLGPGRPSGSRLRPRSARPDRSRGDPLGGGRARGVDLVRCLPELERGVRRLGRARERREGVRLRRDHGLRAEPPRCSRLALARGDRGRAPRGRLARGARAAGPARGTGRLGR